jgi:acetylserotonin N-methyltransferase
MFAAVSLGVCDALHSGPQELHVLARRLNVNSDALERLLDTCVSLKLLTKEGQVYGNTPVATAYLCKNSPQRMTGYINYSNDFLWKLFGNLESAVKEGTNRWKQTFGWDGPIFSHFFRTEDAKREFLMGMHGYGLMSSPQVVAAFDLSEYRCLVDLGGGTGHLAMSACERYSGLRAIVFDLGEVLPLARELVTKSVVSNRVTFVAGDFFSDPLPDGDLLAVGRILHDWSDEKNMTLLRRIYERLPAHGALLIAEKLLDDNKHGPLSAQLQNLNMLICTEGKERTLSEYEAVLRKVGFRNVQGRRTSSPLDAILAQKC